MFIADGISITTDVKTITAKALYARGVGCCMPQPAE